MDFKRRGVLQDQSAKEGRGRGDTTRASVLSQYCLLSRIIAWNAYSLLYFYHDNTIHSTVSFSRFSRQSSLQRNAKVETLERLSRKKFKILCSPQPRQAPSVTRNEKGRPLLSSPWFPLLLHMSHLNSAHETWTRQEYKKPEIFSSESKAFKLIQVTVCESLAGRRGSNWHSQHIQDVHDVL